MENLKQIRHGHSIKGKLSLTYRSWIHMRGRCFNPNDDKYHLYGGRGITICERWELFEHFLEDMGERPSAKHSIDRFPNKDGNYEPGNCRWATVMEQNHNLSTNTNLEYNGETFCASVWARKYNLDLSTFLTRLQRGYSMELALTAKKHKPITRVKETPARRKSYKFINPSGELVEIIGLNKFCDANKLSPGCMCAVHSGNVKHHKGWSKYV